MGLISAPTAGAVPTVTATHTDPAPAIFTTEATVSKNKIEIEIHEDIYAHIGQYLATGDYFHAVEESYKLVREKLREITGKEKAHTPAAPLERKLAVHYISLASLSYDLITRYVSEETIRAIETWSSTSAAATHLHPPSTATSMAASGCVR